MNFIGDYFALGLVIVLCMFFFDRKHSLNQASRYFVCSLILTALTSITDLMTGQLLLLPEVPYWLNMSINSLYFLVNILTTSSIALYLFTRILEHSHDRHCMKNARIGLACCLGVHVLAIIANIWTGWMFYFDEQGQYCRGPLNALGYFITVAQMVLVTICYFRNRKNASQSMRRALIQTFPVVVMCIVIQRMYPEIMLNSLIMSMVVTVLFLTFQGQRQGIHALTKLNDRHRFFEGVNNRIQDREIFQVFLINIKNYSIINQKYGHVFGDEALYQFAFALEKLIKNSEAFHMNGTVFALMIPYTDHQVAEKNVNTLLAFMESGIDCIGKHISFDYITVEYIAYEHETDAEEFYEKLEYAASQAYLQKSRFIRYTPSIGEEMHRRRYLIDRMRTIDHEHGFEVWYQPICSLATGEFSSMEALIRMREPDNTLISPAEFIPLAEEMGITSPITWFVLEDVCKLLKTHPELQHVSVSINLPIAQLLDKVFFVRLDSLVGSYGIDRHRICLEFTEHAIPENFEQAKFMMEQFTEAGYRFYLDDFGAGYSNFNCLLQLPFQLIKLDANLIRMDIGSPDNGLGLTKTLTGFLHSMGLQVIAEGIENAQDVETLRAQGIDLIQGFIFAKPMPEDELLHFYESARTA